MIQAKTKFLKKGISTVGKPLVWCGHDSDDFIQNLWTILVRYDAIKVPRFLAQHKLNKLGHYVVNVNGILKFVQSKINQ